MPFSNTSTRSGNNFDKNHGGGGPDQLPTQDQNHYTGYGLLKTLREMFKKTSVLKAPEFGQGAQSCQSHVFRSGN